MGKIKIVFAGHDLKFAQLIINFLNETGKFEIRTDQWTGHDTHDERHSKECLEWADIIFCEWGLGNAVWYSKYKLPHQKLFVRMHRQELDTKYPTLFHLNNIDKIIAISPYVYEEFYRTFKLPREKMVMIFNTLDAELLNKPKISGSEFNLGIIGIAPKMKRLDLALDILEKLWNIDNRYKLYVKGKMPQEITWLWRQDEQREYYEEQFKRIEDAPWKDAVIFEGFGDVSEFLRKIGFVLSVSDFESFHLAPSEGMASGAIPLILRWDGCETIYKEDYIFDVVDEIVERVLSLNKPETIESMQSIVKGYVKDLFDINIIGEQYLKLLNGKKQL